MIKPTPGRVVLYTPQPNTACMPGQLCAAIIAAVIDDWTINITAFDANGHPYGVQNVMLYQGDPDAQTPPEFGFCQWMPYQQGQAAKSDALVETLMSAMDHQQEALAAMSAKVDMLEGIVARLDASIPAPTAPSEPPPPAAPTASEAPPPAPSSEPANDAAQAGATSATPGQPGAGTPA